MRPTVVLLALVLAVPVAAQPKKPAAPSHPEAASSVAKKLGGFEDWIAATHQESGQTVCYAFTYAKHSTPVISGRDPVVLTVTERAGGRDAVAISAGFDYGKNAAVNMQVDTTGLDFYTAQRNAFARDGKAAVAAFSKAAQAQARSPGPRDGQLVVDTFSLRGFSAAYAAITKACPARG
jgi:predicted SnoaL-like aldol condensation-catalyzing enzyme